MWTCKCGQTNEGRYCQNCRAERPGEPDASAYGGPAGRPAAAPPNVRKIFSVVMMALIAVCLFLPVLRADLLFTVYSANMFTLGATLLRIGSALNSLGVNAAGISAVGAVCFVFLIIPVFELIYFYGIITGKEDFANKWSKAAYIATLACTVLFYGFIIAINASIGQYGGSLATSAVGSIVSLQAGIFLLTVLSVIGLLTNPLLKAIAPASGVSAHAGYAEPSRVEPKEAAYKPEYTSEFKPEPKTDYTPSPDKTYARPPSSVPEDDKPSAPTGALKTTIGMKPSKKPSDADSYFNRPEDL